MLKPLHIWHPTFCLILGGSLCEDLGFFHSYKTSPRSSKSEFVWKSCACFSIWVQAVFCEAGSSGLPGSSGGRKFRACPEVPGCVFLCVTGRFGGALYKVPFFPNELGFHTSEISPFLRALSSSAKPKSSNTFGGKLAHGSRVHLLTSSIVPLLSHPSIALVAFVGIWERGIWAFLRDLWEFLREISSKHTSTPPLSFDQSNLWFEQVLSISPLILLLLEVGDS